jgi:hypothetical protein
VPGDSGDLRLGAARDGERVTAVPRRSLKVIPMIPAALQAIRQLARNPPDVHGLPTLLVGMIVLHFAAVSSAALSGAPTGMTRARAGLGLPQAGCESHHKPTTAGAGDRLAPARSTAQATAADANALARV